jgi:low affinity Fe/Cu permease
VGRLQEEGAEASRVRSGPHLALVLGKLKFAARCNVIGSSLPSWLLGTAFAREIYVGTTRRMKAAQDLALGEKLPQRGLAHTFSRFASRTADWMGAPLAFLIAVLLIVVWLLTGPVFGFSTEWQLIVNSGTTIATFLMVFLIQNTQNRDARAIHLKLDELLRATPKARNEFMEVEEEDLEEIEREKAIIDAEDPAPPRERAHRNKLREDHRGNGTS